MAIFPFFHYLQLLQILSLIFIYIKEFAINKIKIWEMIRNYDEMIKYKAQRNF